MKNIFIINPQAGAKNAVESVNRALAPFKDAYDCAVYVTKGPGDATRYVEDYCRKHAEPVHFFACGGDGTLNEVLNGAVHFKNAMLGCYPCGSGNDYVKYYGGKNLFLDMEALLKAKPYAVDLMEVEGKYSLNVVNFGFDTAVLKTMLRVKRLPFLGGKRAYFAGVITALFTAVRNRCEVFVDHRQLNRKEMMLCTVANGDYVGGSFRCAPNSDNTDGLLEVCLFQPVPLPTFIRLIQAYKNGQHLTESRCQKWMRYVRGKTVQVSSPEKNFCYSLDGELIYSSSFTITAVPGGIRFLLPETAAEFRQLKEERKTALV